MAAATRTDRLLSLGLRGLAAATLFYAGHHLYPIVLESAVVNNVRLLRADSALLASAGARRIGAAAARGPRPRRRLIDAGAVPELAWSARAHKEEEVRAAATDALGVLLGEEDAVGGLSEGDLRAVRECGESCKGVLVVLERGKEGEGTPVALEVS